MELKYTFTHILGIYWGTLVKKIMEGVTVDDDY